MREKAPPERADLVDDVYAPFVRPLGNLIVLFAQAEAEWLCLASELSGCTEKEAQRFLDIKPDVKQEITSLAQRCGIEGFDLQELSTSIENYCCDGEHRNQLMHGNWYVSLLKVVGRGGGAAAPPVQRRPARSGRLTVGAPSSFTYIPVPTNFRQ